MYSDENFKLLTFDSKTQDFDAHFGDVGGGNFAYIMRECFPILEEFFDLHCTDNGSEMTLKSFEQQILNFLFWFSKKLLTSSR